MVGNGRPCYIQNIKNPLSDHFIEFSFINLCILGGGVLRLGGNGLAGKISDFNVWHKAIKRNEISQRALGCGIDIGDVISWSNLRGHFLMKGYSVMEPSCLDAGGENIDQWRI